MPISSFLGWISSFSVMPEMSSLGVFFGKRSSLLFWQKGNFIFVGKRNTTFTNIQKTSYFHTFFEKYHLSFSVCKKHHIFGKKKCHLSSWYKKDHIPVQFFWKDHLFRTFEEYIIFHVSFWERLSFIFRLKNNIIFLGKRNIIFPDDTRKIIFQCNFFGKNIFAEHLEKENMVFRVFRTVNKKYFVALLISQEKPKYEICLMGIENVNMLITIFEIKLKQVTFIR